MVRWLWCNCQTQGPAGGQCSTSHSLFRLLSFLLRLHYLQTGICRMLLTLILQTVKEIVELELLLLQWGQLHSWEVSARGGCVEPGCLVSASSQNSEALLAEVPHRQCPELLIKDLSLYLKNILPSGLNRPSQMGLMLIKIVSSEEG